MSPEQAAGRTDFMGTATDVYSLGATLYCLLTGKAPFNNSDIGRLLHNIQKGDFPPPRKINPESPPPLEAICLKAMALQPKDRYASPRALADDIEHWLADEPVGVFRDPWLARVGRWARRHKPWVAGMTALVVTVLVALAISTVLIWREEARTKEQRRQAEANFQTALQAVNDMLTEVAQEDLANEPRMEKKRRALLVKAKAYYAAFLEKKSDDPELRQETGLAYKRLADISRLLGENDQAAEAYDQAIALLDRLAPNSHADPRFRQIMADSYCYLGEILRLRSQPAEARQAYDLAENLQSQLVAEFPGNADYRKDLSRCHYNLGILLKDTRRPQEAEKEFHLAIELLDKLVQEHPETAEYRRHLARAYLNIGPALRINGRPDQAEDAYQQAIRLQKDLVEKNPSNPDYQYELGVSYNNLGFLLENLRRYPDAEKAQSKALERFDRLMVYYPGIPVYRKEWANTQNNLAIVLAREDRGQAAVEAWHKSLDVFKKLAEENSDVPDYRGSQGMALGNLGWALLQTKRPRNEEELSQARQYLEEGMALVRVALKPNPENPTYLRALRDQHEYLAETMLRLGDHARAAKTAEELPAILTDMGKDDFLASGFLARCAEQARKDPMLAPAERQSLAGQYETRSMIHLEEAVRKGFKDRDQLNQEPFKALQNREDFRKLLEKIQKGG
jgi:tetratricopeptide (TPR) repeat protein